MTAPTGAATHRQSREWWLAFRAFALTLALLVVLLFAVSLLSAALDAPELAGNVVSLALPAFLAGVLSVLSPCSFPILIGYFSVALQERRERIGMVTVAFLTGVATTMAVLGAGFTTLGSLALDHQRMLAVIGGILVTGFGIMSLLGKGFGGLRVANRPGVTSGGAYLYGLIFALGWTACVGPILGSILTLLLVEGSTPKGVLSLLAGGLLAVVYVLGLGLPIFLVVFLLLGGQARGKLSRLLRGQGWELRVGNVTLFAHSTSLISGVLLISLGVLLLTGQMTALSAWLAQSPLATLGLRLEEWLDRMW